MRLKDLFILSWKKFVCTLIAWVVAVIIHNLFYAIFGFEEPVFFVIAVLVIPLYLIIAGIYTIVRKIGKKK